MFTVDAVMDLSRVEQPDLIGLRGLVELLIQDVITYFLFRLFYPVTLLDLALTLDGHQAFDPLE